MGLNIDFVSQPIGRLTKMSNVPSKRPQWLVGGVVNADASIASGYGFTCRSGGTGLYDIHFDEHFAATPGTVAKQYYPGGADFADRGGDARDNAIVVAADGTSIRIKTGNGGGEATNRKFAFIAFAPGDSYNDQKLIVGQVNADGSIKAGEDFSVTRIGVGLYLVHFDRDFSALPVAVGIQCAGWDNFDFDGGNKRDNITIVAANVSQVLFKTGKDNGEAEDRAFTFIAYDPNPGFIQVRRVVAATIDANGTVNSGPDTGVVVVDDGAGEYTCVFGAGQFTAPPAVVATQNYPGWDSFGNSGGDTRDNAIEVAVSAQKVKISTGDGDGKSTDRNFSLVAVEIK